MATTPNLRVERVRAVFAQMPLALAATLVNASLAAALVVLDRSDWRAAIWFAVVLSISALRFESWRRFQATQMPQDPGWDWALAGGGFAAGCAWGGGALWLMPTSESYRLFWTFLIGGMCAGAAALHYPHRLTVFAFLLPAGLPLALRLALEGIHQSVVEALMTVVFITSLAVAAQRFGRQFDSMIRIQIDLEALQAQLAAEIVEHRATEENLRQAQKMEAVGQLTGGLAHDFNNLLMAVLGSLKLLRKRLPPDDAKAQQLIENALAGAERGASLTRRLLAFGRRQPNRTERVDLSRLVRGMGELLRNSLSPAINLQLRLPADLPAVRVDANQLELALLNLVVNARDAMPAGGTITIAGRVEEPAPETLPPGQYVVLSVSDTGEGMDEEVLARATEPFFTTKETGKGTGLGLPMVQGLALGAGGHFVLRSVRGIGTEAELWLPQAPHSDEQEKEPEEPSLPALGPQPLQQRQVLLVDDDALVLASTRDMLEDLGHAVLEANSGPEALALLREGRPVDLIITDYAMPGMTGVQLAEAAQALRPGLKVLLATGYADLPQEGEVHLPRLTKPFGVEALAAATGV